MQIDVDLETKDNLNEVNAETVRITIILQKWVHIKQGTCLIMSMIWSM